MKSTQFLISQFCENPTFGRAERCHSYSFFCLSTEWYTTKYLYVGLDYPELGSKIVLYFCYKARIQDRTSGWDVFFNLTPCVPYKPNREGCVSGNSILFASLRNDSHLDSPARPPPFSTFPSFLSVLICTSSSTSYFLNIASQITMPAVEDGAAVPPAQSHMMKTTKRGRPFLKVRWYHRAHAQSR